MTTHLLLTSCSNTSTSELLKFFICFESGAPPTLHFLFGHSWLLSQLFFCDFSVSKTPCIMCLSPCLMPFYGDWQGISIFYCTTDIHIHHFLFTKTVGFYIIRTQLRTNLQIMASSSSFFLILWNHCSTVEASSAILLSYLGFFKIILKGSWLTHITNCDDCVYPIYCLFTVQYTAYLQYGSSGNVQRRTKVTLLLFLYLASVYSGKCFRSVIGMYIVQTLSYCHCHTQQYVFSWTPFTH